MIKKADIIAANKKLQEDLESLKEEYESIELDSTKFEDSHDSKCDLLELLQLKAEQIKYSSTFKDLPENVQAIIEMLNNIQANSVEHDEERHKLFNMPFIL